mgnify:CR=1 FL=1
MHCTALKVFVVGKQDVGIDGDKGYFSAQKLECPFKIMEGALSHEDVEMKEK